MTLLPTAEINAMRTVAAQTLDGTAIISTRTFASDGGGGGTATWTPSGTVVCHLSPANTENTEKDIGDRIAADADWIVTLPALTTVTTKNRVTIAGTNYNIEACRAPRTWELTRRLEVNQEV